MPIDNEIATFLAKHFEENTPLEGNRCKQEECDGEVVAEVVGLFHRRLYHSMSACNKCGRIYIFAKNVRTVGHEEFMRKLREPMTI